MTYAELAVLTNRIAAATIAAADGRSGPVAILLPATTGLPAAIMGVLAAGRAYVAIDPDVPGDRNALIISESDACAVISTSDVVRLAQAYLPDDLPLIDNAQRLSQDWPEPAVVDTRPGATGSIGAEVVVQAKPDGYTLLFTVDLPITMAPNLLKVPYDPQRDLIPIAAVVEANNVLVTNAATGIKTLAELIAAAKAKPGVLTFSSAGIGSPAHFCGEMIDHQAGITMTHVPYKGAAAAMNAVLAGTVTAFCGPIAQAQPFLKSGPKCMRLGSPVQNRRRYCRKWRRSRRPIPVSS